MHKATDIGIGGENSEQGMLEAREQEQQGVKLKPFLTGQTLAQDNGTFSSH